MKRLILFISFTVPFLTRSYAQASGSFISQQSSKVKIMIAQIAALEAQLKFIKSGYEISERGWSAAQELKGGTLSLHSTYLSSLKQVNPLVSVNLKGKMMSEWQQHIHLLFRNEIDWQQKQRALKTEEMGYIRQVYGSLEKKCQSDIDELSQVLIPGKLQMTDQERLELTDHLYASMQEKYAFASSFTNQCRQLATARLKAQQENRQLQKLYGIN